MPYLVASDVATESPGARFRHLLENSGILQIPGAHNGMAAIQAKGARDSRGLLATGLARHQQLLNDTDFAVAFIQSLKMPKRITDTKYSRSM